MLPVEKANICFTDWSSAAWRPHDIACHECTHMQACELRAVGTTHFHSLARQKGT